jgi:hypothetical protein
MSNFINKIKDWAENLGRKLNPLSEEIALFPLYDVAGDVNLVGRISKRIWGDEARRDGFKMVMMDARMKEGWEQEAPFFEKPVDVLDMVLDRNLYRHPDYHHVDDAELRTKANAGKARTAKKMKKTKKGRS